MVVETEKLSSQALAQQLNPPAIAPLSQGGMMLIRVKKVMALGFILLALPSASSAHEGHDNGAKKPAVAADSGMIARTARLGDYEMIMKHPALEPLHEHSAHLFITRYAT